MQISPADSRSIRLTEGDSPIPGFRLVRPRGRGGFGEVWEAEASGGFRVALKFVRLSSRALASELRSLEFVRGIHHPNLLANFGAWQVDDTLIIGMELADRSLWDRYIEAADKGLRGIPRGELLGYMSEVAAGIGHLNDYRHTLDGRTGIGVQHRDLKPTNILLFGGGAKVADLGMARAMEGSVAGHTGIWTYSYAAPEFFRGETARQSDQYGLAVTYCQLRTGRLPYEGNAASVTAGHLFGRPDLDALPEPERPIVERALAKTPGDRWPDCRAFADALRSIPAGLVPDELIAPDDSYDIAREFRSSTGLGSAPFPDFEAGAGLSGSLTGGTGWPGVTPTDDPGPRPGLSDRPFDRTAPFAPPDGRSADSHDLVDTQIFPTLRPETPAVAVGPGPEIPPAGRPGPRGRLARLGRNASVALVAAVALVTAGVRGSARPEHVPAPVATPGPPDPASIVGVGIGTAAELDPDAIVRLPEPDETPAPLPSQARTSPKPAGPVPPGPEPEPAPAPAAEESPAALPPAPGPAAADPKPAAGGPEVRSDLTPARRARPAGSGDAPVILEPIPEADREGPARPTAPAAGRPVDAPVRVASVFPVSPPAPTRGPSPAMAALTRGLAHLGRDAFGPAVTEFEEAIRLDPGQATSYLLRALARHREGYPKSALADYDEAIRLRPGDVEAYIARGQAHHDLGSYARAIADLDEAVRLRPDDPDPRFRRGMARYRSDDFAGSVADFDETIRLDPKNARAATFRADALTRLASPTGRVPAPGPGAARPLPTPSAIPTSSSTAPMVTAPAPPATAPRQQKAAPPPRRNPPARRLLPWPWPRSK